ncbi:hypothetical protein Cni_G08834 [Canna indica]|uniref:phospholipase D n=1 Tax=Canna indica TaxID=4628 RepID=A0AAQ3Q889_9LILI|nr:hypothetical protein Cni_G08834 [Canna indica]
MDNNPYQYPPPHHHQPPYVFHNPLPPYGYHAPPLPYIYPASNPAPFHYPPPAYYLSPLPPPSASAAPLPPANYPYDTYFYPQPYAYPQPIPHNSFSPRPDTYPQSIPHDGFSPLPDAYPQSIPHDGFCPRPDAYPLSIPHDSLLPRPDASDHASSQSSVSSTSSSIYPINRLLARVRLNDLQLDPNPSHQRLGSYDYQQQSFHGSHSPGVLVAPPPEAPFAESQHGAFIPLSGSAGDSQYGAIVPFTGSVPSKGLSSLKVLLLHGSLDIWVYEAKNLPNLDLFHKALGDVFGSRITNTISGKGDHMTSDPYVTITVCEAAIARTYVVDNSEDPVWMQHFNVPVAHHAAEVEFVVKDSDIVGAELIGTVSIPTEQIYSGEKVEGTFPILGPNGKQCKPGAVLRMSIQYIPMERLSVYDHGVGDGPDYCGVPDTYFPLRKGGKVTLYQDAHVPDGCLPDLWLGNGMCYAHGKCWHDISDAISNARRLIYIIGWSIFHTVRLVRDAGDSSSVTLGDLLKSKSQEGVRVLLLVWDDPTSRRILGYRTDGVMGTRDEETRRFFRHSSVQVLLCPRSAGKKHSFAKQQETGTIYTHHQKQVVVDADAGNFKRKIIAFIGGLDLCGGRYDTPQHPIFRTLQTVHKDDYHNPNFVSYDESGPREPWHDLHSRIDGPAAYDVLRNFEERWSKASKHHGIKKLKKSSDDALLSIERIPDIIGLDELSYMNDNDPETWHVQIFRSIDSDSVKGFPKDPREATHKNLVCGKNVLIDMSIHKAYVHAIRSAQHFIYIENQYFLGSSFNWDSNKSLGANNLIPIEIAFKIANKIKANERFSAYIVVPMWPEGNPTGAPTQRILHWQNKTMQMMYETIYTALKEVGLENTYEPQDYLNFFCLGNREGPDLNNASQISESSAQALVKKTRRFMVYVHSKGMIVDDEYIIIGSANINQRSLEGTRDTEIAMGAYQPEHTWERQFSGPRGQIFGYRMSLWAEHLGTIEDCFTIPESLECMQRVRELGQMNWRQYVADDITEMNAHLLKYPVEVDRRGKVKPLPGYETFPDIGGNICGSFFGIQENLTI